MKCILFMLILVLESCSLGISQTFTFRDQPWLGQQFGKGGATANTLTNGLVGYWRMDVFNSFKDAIGANDLTDEGAMLGIVPNSRIFQAATGGGASSGIRLSHVDNKTFSPDTNAGFTVSLWVNANGAAWPGNFPAILDKGLFNTHPNGYLIYYDNSTFHSYIGSSTGIVGIVSSLGAPDTTTWYNLVLRGNPTNGVETLNVNGTSIQDTALFNKVFATNGLKFSLFSPSDIGSDCYGALIDDVGLWNRCLSDAEVQSLYTTSTSYGVGEPYTQQLTNTYWVMSARGLNEPTVQSMFQSNTWTYAHLATTNLIPNLSMYGSTNAGWGDSVYGSITEQVRTNFPPLTGTRTNGFVIFSPGIENDIIVINEGVNGGGTTFTITNTVISVSNAAATLISRGYRLLVVSTADVIGFTPSEEADLSYANSWLTNLPGIDGVVDAWALIKTNVDVDPDWAASSRTNVAVHINTKATAVWP